MDPFVNPRASRIAAQADKLVSKIHDSLWDFDGQPYDQKARPSWDLHRDEMNGLIWKLHELLRPVAAECSISTTADSGGDPESPSSSRPVSTDEEEGQGLEDGGLQSRPSGGRS